MCQCAFQRLFCCCFFVLYLFLPGADILRYKSTMTQFSPLPLPLLSFGCQELDNSELDVRTTMEHGILGDFWQPAMDFLKFMRVYPSEPNLKFKRG